MQIENPSFPFTNPIKEATNHDQYFNITHLLACLNRKTFEKTQKRKIKTNEARVNLASTLG